MEKKPIINSPGLGTFSIIIEAFKLLLKNGQILVLLFPLSIIIALRNLFALNDAAQIHQATSLPAVKEAIVRLAPEAAFDLFFLPWIWFFSRAAVALAVGLVYSDRQVDFTVVTILCKSWKRIAITTMWYILAEVALVVSSVWVSIDSLIVLTLTIKASSSDLIKVAIAVCILVVLFMLLGFILWFRTVCNLTAVVTALEQEKIGFEAFKRGFKLLGKSRTSTSVGVSLEIMFMVCSWKLTLLTMSALPVGLLVNSLVLLVNLLVQTLFSMSMAVFYLVLKDMDTSSLEDLLLDSPAKYVEV